MKREDFFAAVKKANEEALERYRVREYAKRKNDEIFAELLLDCIVEFISGYDYSSSTFRDDLLTLEKWERLKNILKVEEYSFIQQAVDDKSAIIQLVLPTDEELPDINIAYVNKFLEDQEVSISVSRINEIIMDIKFNTNIILETRKMIEAEQLSFVSPKKTGM